MHPGISESHRAAAISADASRWPVITRVVIITPAYGSRTGLTPMATAAHLAAHHTPCRQEVKTQRLATATTRQAGGFAPDAPHLVERSGSSQAREAGACDNDAPQIVRSHALPQGDAGRRWRSFCRVHCCGWTCTSTCSRVVCCLQYGFQTNRRCSNMQKRNNRMPRHACRSVPARLVRPARPCSLLHLGVRDWRCIRETGLLQYTVSSCSRKHDCSPACR